jgi:hypothetical protein
VGTKKAQSKSKGTAKKSAKKKRATAKSKKPVDMVQVRTNISNLVGASANVITNKVIEVAKTGALAPAKYLFEMAGLYPATEATAAKPEGDSFAQTLMNRLGGPPEPEAAREEDEEEAPDSAPGTAAETVKAEAAPGNCAGEGEPGEGGK